MCHSFPNLSFSLAGTEQKSAIQISVLFTFWVKLAGGPDPAAFRQQLFVLASASEFSPPQVKMFEGNTSVWPNTPDKQAQCHQWIHGLGLGFNCVICPGGLEVSGGTVEANHVMSQWHWSSFGPSELMSTCVSALDCMQLSRITSPCKSVKSLT